MNPSYTYLLISLYACFSWGEAKAAEQSFLPPLDLPITRWCSDGAKTWFTPWVEKSGVTAESEKEADPLLGKGVRAFPVGEPAVKNNPVSGYGIVSSQIWSTAPVTASLYKVGQASFKDGSVSVKTPLANLIVADLFCFPRSLDIASLCSSATNLRVLICPWVGIDKLEGIKFPSTLEHLYIFNESIKASDWNKIMACSGLKSLSLRGCFMTVGSSRDPIDRPRNSEFGLPLLEELDLVTDDLALVAKFCGYNFNTLKTISLGDPLWFFRPFHQGSLRDYFPVMSSVHLYSDGHVKPDSAIDRAQRFRARTIQGGIELTISVHAFSPETRTQ